MNVSGVPPWDTEHAWSFPVAGGGSFPVAGGERTEEEDETAAR